MKTVIIIRDGRDWSFIGVAKDIKSALTRLWEEQWIKPSTIFYNKDTGKEIELEEVKKMFGAESYLETLILMWNDDPDWWFENLFDIFEENVYEA